MEIIRQYSIYVYIPLIAAIIAVLVVLLMKIVTFFKHLKEKSPQFESISNNINKASQKAERVSQSRDSFTFVLAVLAIFGFAKDVRRNRRRNYSITNSIARAAFKNSSGLKNIRM